MDGVPIKDIYQHQRMKLGYRSLYLLGVVFQEAVILAVLGICLDV